MHLSQEPSSVRLAVPRRGGAARAARPRVRRMTGVSRVLSSGLAVLLLSFLGPLESVSAVVEYRSAEEIATRSTQIVIGDVVDVASSWTADGSRIKSRILVHVADYIWGTGGGFEVLEMSGGTVGGMTLEVSVLPTFKTGDHVLLFLDDGEIRLVESFQGAYLTDGQEIARMAPGCSRVIDSSREPIAEFLNRISHALGISVTPNDLTPYEGSFVLPPDEIRYEECGYDWTYKDDPMDEDYFINANCSDSAAGDAASQRTQIRKGMTAWNTAGAKFVFSYGGTSTLTQVDKDNTNLIYFDNSPPDGGSYIACNYSWVSDGDLVESDIVFNDRDYTWWNGSGSGSDRMDIWNIATHELGHTLCLKDLYDDSDSEKTMYGYGDYSETKKRTLHSDDIDGIVAIYGKASISLKVTRPMKGKIHRHGHPDIPDGAPYGWGMSIYVGPYIECIGETESDQIASVMFTCQTEECTDGSGMGGVFTCNLDPFGFLQIVGATAYGSSGNKLAAPPKVPTLYLATPGSPPGEPCWLAGTCITMADGSYQDIEDISVGDEVLAYDLLKREALPALVTVVQHHAAEEMGEYYLVINGNLRMTPGHLLPINGVLTVAEAAKPGDQLVQADGDAIVIETIEKVYDQVPTYNFEVGTEGRTCDAYCAYVAEDIVAYPRKGGGASWAASLLYDYEMFDLQTLDGMSESYAYALNQAGIVVGESGGKAFAWEYGHGMEELWDGAAYAVSDTGYAAGTDAFGQPVYVDLADEQGEVVQLPLDGRAEGSVRGINDAGDMVGEADGEAVIWFATGEVLHLCPGIAYAINDASPVEVVGQSGQYAFRWKDGDLSTLWSGGAYDVNDAGQIVGTSNGHAVRWEGGELTDLGTGVGYAINDVGQVVGEDASGAFIWDPNTGRSALDEEICSWSGWEPIAARDLNDVGQIAGWGEIGSQIHAYQATSTAADDAGGNGIPDACEPDCNDNGEPDDYDIASGSSQDCNANGIPDECDLADGTSSDCNSNGVPDACDVAEGTSADCNANGVPDECDLADGASDDCNLNGVPDECDIADGTSNDVNGNGIPDECECISDVDTSGVVDVSDLLMLLATWGPCPPEGVCYGDIDDDGDVDVVDLLQVLSDWGPCD